MKSLLNKKTFLFLLCFINLLGMHSGYAAISQILNDNFFQNPAELNLVQNQQVIGGAVFINPVISFDGSAYGSSGRVESNVHDYLPYLLSAARFSEKLVIGFNAVPSAYGHLSWPIDSMVAQASTLTKLLYYRFGLQSSYQLTDKLALGAGFNMEDNAQYKLNFVIPGQGEQANSITGLNYTSDFGLYYKINTANYLTIAGYTQVNTYGHGSSIVGSTANYNLSLNITQAPVVYVGLQHLINERWFLEEKIYWSGWSIQKNINFENTSTGSYIVPTNWRDVWSLQLATRYAFTDKLGLLASVMYETNPVSVATNAIGYPLAASAALSGGVDITVQKTLAVQVIYSYGQFIPHATINNSSSAGTMDAHSQAGVLQVVYKK